MMALSCHCQLLIAPLFNFFLLKSSQNTPRGGLQIYSKVYILDDKQCPDIYQAQLPSQEDRKLLLFLP